MEKTLHVLDSDLAAKTLRQVLGEEVKDIDISYFLNPLFYTPIPEKFNYSENVDSIYRKISPRIRTAFKESLSVFYREGLEQYDKVVVWHSNDPSSEFFFCMMAAFIEEHDNMYEVDLSKIQKGYVEGPTPTSCFNDADFVSALKHVERIKKGSERMDELAASWLSLLFSSNLRSWQFMHHGCIHSPARDIIDNVIAETLSEHPLKHYIYRDIPIIWAALIDVSENTPILALIKERLEKWGYQLSFCPKI